MIKFIALGFVQGLTEFFPISSSGHLVILERLLGVTDNELAITVLLHIGTILALLVFFIKDIFRVLRDARFLLMAAIATVITVIIALSAKDFFVAMFSSPRAVGVSLLITGCFLTLTKPFLKGETKEVGFLNAVIFGLAQAVAIIPGISRSGATISALLFRGVDRDTAFMFSFVASIPAVMGAVVLETKDIHAALRMHPADAYAGVIASFISGICALAALKALIRKAKFYYFGYYCIVVGLLTFLFLK